jgi:hypothetical protein
MALFTVEGNKVMGVTEGVGVGEGMGVGEGAGFLLVLYTTKFA